MAHNIVILTGAGISAESGIPTYRDPGGLWSRFDPEEVSDIRGWKRNPQKVLDFKNEMRRMTEAGNYQPNAAHLALTRLQKEWKHGDVCIITQNVDGLHTRAGSEVLEMHGTNLLKRCDACGDETPYDADIVLSQPCRACGKTASIRASTVLFGEMPRHLDIIQKKLANCGIFASIGTSGNVSPASDFVQMVPTRQTFLFNIEDHPGTLFPHRCIGPATVEVPKWVDILLG